MSTPHLSPAEIKRTKEAWEATYSNTAAAKLLGIPYPTFSARKRELGLTTPDKPVEALKIAQKHQDELKALRSQIAALTKELNESDDVRATVFALKDQDTTPPAWVLKPSSKKRTSQIPLLMLSDFHLGEYISGEEMDGINSFDIKVARERYRKLIEKTITLSRDHMGLVQPEYPGIVYLRGGDLIAGMIHDLHETNDRKALAAVKELVALERWGLEQLKAFFGKVFVVSTPGNHGRDSEKPHSKEVVARSFDIQAAEMLELIYENDPAFTFWNPPSGDALFRIKGSLIGATHGDRIGTGGGRGFLGAVGPIMRGAKMFREYYAALGKNIDVVFMGHYHTSCELPGNIFANGCVCGVSQYSRQFRFVPRPAVQWLVFFGDHGITARWEIQLAERPTIKQMTDFEKEN